MPFVLWFDEIDPEGVDQAGGKGASLARMTRAGFPVPPGFAILADAYRAAVAARPDGEPDDGHPPLPLDVAHEVLTEFERLREEVDPGTSFAVRSSATAEDGGEASFAGQHATILNVREGGELLRAVQDCWASLHDHHARRYREAVGVNEDEAAMAVVVQAMVPAEVSGVAFTIDPVTGQDDVILVDASWGLGEAIVSGLVTPDHYRIRKSDLAVLDRQVHEKSLRVIPTEGGTRQEEVPSGQAHAACLSDGHLRQLAELVRSVERHYGAPQDVEWAYASGQFYLLQSRPVTAVAAPAPAAGPEDGWVSEFDTVTDDQTTWTAANVQEVLPGLLTPLTWSVMQRGMEVAFNRLFYSMGVLDKEDLHTPFVGLFYSRAFLNLSALREVSDRTPFTSPEAVDEQYLGKARPETPTPRPLTWRRLRNYARAVPSTVRVLLTMPSRVKREERQMADFVRRMEALDPAGLSNHELVALSREGLAVSGQMGALHIAVTSAAGSAFESLRQVLEKALGGNQAPLQAQLCTGLDDVASAMPSYKIWDLSRLALASEELRAAFAETGDMNAVLERIRARGSEDARRFLAALDEFLEAFGHRSVMEGEIAAPSWSEDPGYVLGMVANYLRADESASPYRIHERQRYERMSAERNVRARLNPVQRALFNYTLKQAQAYVPMREATKSMLIKVGHVQRKFAYESARRLVAMGVIDDPSDAFYLTLDESSALLERGPEAAPDARERVRRRREEYRRNEAVRLPESFTGRPRPLVDTEPDVPEDRVLRGIPVSPGRVTARARVILDPRKDGHIEPGEVLVAPVTDAGWTPLFVPAAAVVVDVGGPLSHGSTVAREYGLPAVVNVKTGTRTIKTGQMITVDGTRGMVYLEPEEGRNGG